MKYLLKLGNMRIVLSLPRGKWQSNMHSSWFVQVLIYRLGLHSKAIGLQSAHLHSLEKWRVVYLENHMYFVWPISAMLQLNDRGIPTHSLQNQSRSIQLRLGFSFQHWCVHRWCFPVSHSRRTEKERQPRLPTHVRTVIRCFARILCWFAIYGGILERNHSNVLYVRQLFHGSFRYSITWWAVIQEYRYRRSGPRPIHTLEWPGNQTI